MKDYEVLEEMTLKESAQATSSRPEVFINVSPTTVTGGIRIPL